MVNYDDSLYQEIVNYYSYNDAAALKIDDSTINQYSTIITSATLPVSVIDRTI